MSAMEDEMDTTEDLLKRFRRLQAETANLQAALHIVEWDKETAMPEGGSAHRSEVTAALTGLIHERETTGAYAETLERLKEEADAGRLAGLEALNVGMSYRLFDRERRLSSELVAELAKTTSAAHHAWIGARKRNDFAGFRPVLERIVALTREKADMYGWTATPYDPLLEDYEPGATVAGIRPVLEDLRDFLVPFVARIGASQVRPTRHRVPMDIASQRGYCRTVAARLGFDFKTGALATVAHPMCGRNHPGDVRISTNYDPGDLLDALGSVIHETGHALYDQGLPAEWYGTPLGEGVSMAVHESQSRLWENIVGRGRLFCHWLATSDLGWLKSEQLYGTLNIVKPSLIRVQADEVTYNLHICLRFELELDLIEGRLDVKDLPEAWNARMKSYLGLDVPSDANGVLQDVHWPSGDFAYFPTYGLGNLMSAQFYAAADRDLRLSRFDDRLAQDAPEYFAALRGWLRAHVHQKGATRTADELLREATGEPLSPRFFTSYLEQKFGELYRL